MRSRRNELTDHLLTHEVAANRDLGDLVGSAHSAVRRGELVTLLPGIHVSIDPTVDRVRRLQVLMNYAPSAVITGETAAALHLQTPLPEVLSAAARIESRHPGFEFSRRRIASDWVTEIGRLRVTSPELTAVDLIPTHGPDVLDALLRRAGGQGQEFLDRCWEALRTHPNRRGNGFRAAVLRESRDLPWSSAERLAHTLLRRGRITGWTTNHAFWWGGRCLFLDIAFPAKKVAIEIDGFEFHRTREQFENDRARWNDILDGGWNLRVFTWPTLQDPGFFVSRVRRLVA